MGANPRFHRVFNKLRAWELDRNAKVCLLDTDTLIVKNADELLSFPAPTTLIRGQELPGWHHSPKSRRKKVRAPSDYLFASARPLSNDYLQESARLLVCPEAGALAFVQSISKFVQEAQLRSFARVVKDNWQNHVKAMQSLSKCIFGALP